MEDANHLLSKIEVDEFTATEVGEFKGLEFRRTGLRVARQVVQGLI